ncbi:BrnA antitoxin family protein [Microvirga terrae]|uniref:BrnA antitoxin family protein n=1 Tax=Microvirga terrae TaxID=2740529 RepID=A0ABY5RUT2_9HYPH|nr:BrnA antitoxin family protein [Microvirga terrae]UVF20699.1 BrnA antitoxin family protein [Microvirga terrae]
MTRSTGGRRSSDPLKAAEAAFKKATTKPIEGPPKATVIPGVKETITLRIDQDVLAFFQDDGPGWQDRINAALRKVAGKSDN